MTDLLSLCAAVRASITGAGEPMDPAELREAQALLRQRLVEWKPSFPGWESYDAGVRQIVAATIRAMG